MNPRSSNSRLAQRDRMNVEISGQRTTTTATTHASTSDRTTQRPRFERVGSTASTTYLDSAFGMHYLVAIAATLSLPP
jgi:hypothetical protein